MTDNQTPAVQPPQAPPPAPQSSQPPPAGQAPVPTENHMVEAFKMLIHDPIGNLKPAYEHLGAGRALGMGVALCVIFTICLIIALAKGRGSVSGGGFGSGFYSGNLGLTPEDALKTVFVALTVVLGLSIGSLVSRSMSAGGGSYSQDLYVAGLALLPMSPCMVLAAFYHSSYPAVMSGVLMLGGIFLVLAMYSAGLDLHRMTRRASSLMTTIVLMITGSATYMMAAALLNFSLSK
jgi:hypothetical protein